MFDPILAEIRFGCGLSPVVAPVPSTQAMLDRLTGPDEIAGRFPVPDYEEFTAYLVEATEIAKQRKKSRGSPEFKDFRKARNLLNKKVRIEEGHWLWMTLQRRAHTADGLRERLTAFWADHFTAQGKAGVMRRGASPYIESAIRPHVAGRFADMLKSVATQPLMLHYLDQQLSMGPGSDKAERRGDKAGLNENLAREMLELHTLGVESPYEQRDVRELAELLTGLSYRADRGFEFRKDYAEPGAETVLGVQYGGDGKAKLSDILAALDDLARHPATAQHLARKLAIHFLGDTPDEAVVDHLAQRFSETDGDLAQVTAALLDHPAAWTPQPANVKQPVDFIGSAMRALAVAPEALDGRDEKLVNRILRGPLARMGQNWHRALGPDGWPEEDEEWIAPQRLAARIDWAMRVPLHLDPTLPDPRDFVDTALATRAGDAVRFAAAAAENRQVGIALILVSPEFQRM